MRPLNVALTTNFSPWSPYSGGGQRSTHQIAVALVKRGHRVTVVYTRAPFERFDVPQVPYAIRWAGFFAHKSHRAAPLRPLNALTVAAAVESLHAERPLDALHGNGEEAALAVALMRQRPAVTTVITPRYPSYPAPLLADEGPTLPDLTRLAFFDSKYLLIGLAARFADWCCPTSRSAADQLQRAFQLDPDRVRIVPNGIDPIFFQYTWSRGGLSSGPVVFFGRLSHDKGADVLLNALALLRERRGDAPGALLIGRGDCAEQLGRQIEDLGLSAQVRLEPWMTPEALARTIAAASVVALPSRHESFGNAMAEAMAVGAPLVSSRAGSIPEVVEDGRTGLLVPPDDPRALAEAIARLLDDPGLAARLGAQGGERVRQRFSWDSVAASLEALYRREP